MIKRMRTDFMPLYTMFIQPGGVYFILGQNVWEDVIEDSRDFIQEYLEDYPSVRVAKY